jgi:Ni,Fe-hydrogenase I small subunit
MAHYAFLDENNIVTEVITGIDETELIEGLDPETWYGNFRNQVCKRTSYNNNYRFNYAGIGFTYDANADAFISPELGCGHPELTLNTSTYRWECENVEHEPNLI